MECKCGNRLASCDTNFQKAFTHSEKRDGERLSSVILNLSMFSEVICDRCLPTTCYVYHFWLHLLVSNAQLEICLDIYEAQETSDAPIIGSAIGIGPTMRFLGSIGIGKFYR